MVQLRHGSSAESFGVLTTANDFLIRAEILHPHVGSGFSHAELLVADGSDVRRRSMELEPDGQEE